MKIVIPEIEKLKNDMKNMTTEEKLDHIWTYYKLHFLVITIAVVMLAALISMLVESSKKPVISALFCNVNVSETGTSYIKEDFLKEMQAKKSEQVEIYSIYFGETVTELTAKENYAKITSGVSMVAGKEIDYMLVDKVALQTYSKQQMFMDLREFLTDEELAQWKDDLFCCELGREQDVPVALDVSNMPFFSENAKSIGPIYFTVAGNAPRLETCRLFFDHLKQWNA